MKRVALIKEFDNCHKCPFRSGGESLGSPMACTYFDPPKMVYNANGYLVTECHHTERGGFIAKFCELPDDEVYNGLL